MLIERIHYPRGISLPRARKLARDGASESLPTETEQAVDLHPDHQQREDTDRKQYEEDLSDESVADLDTEAKAISPFPASGQIDILA